MLKWVVVLASLCCTSGQFMPDAEPGILGCMPPTSARCPCITRWFYDGDMGRCAQYDAAAPAASGFFDGLQCERQCGRYLPCLRDPIGPGDRCEQGRQPPMPIVYVAFDPASRQCTEEVQYGCGVPRFDFDSTEQCERVCLDREEPVTMPTTTRPPIRTPVPGRCVEFSAHHQWPAPQASAELTCSTLHGGALATIESWAEYERVKETVEQRHYWIGGRFKCPDCKYDWIDCTTQNGSVITSWEIGHIAKVSKEQQTVCLLYDGTVHKVAKANCTEWHPFICERPCGTTSTPPPTVTTTEPTDSPTDTTPTSTDDSTTGSTVPTSTAPSGTCSCVATDSGGVEYEVTARLREDAAYCNVVGKEEIFESTTDKHVIWDDGY